MNTQDADNYIVDDMREIKHQIQYQHTDAYKILHKLLSSTPMFKHISIIRLLTHLTPVNGYKH
jgi:hypothetical protein